MEPKSLCFTYDLEEVYSGPRMKVAEKQKTKICLIVFGKGCLGGWNESMSLF